MAHNQTRMRALGRLVAEAGPTPGEQLAARYRSGLGAALARPARPGNNVNVLMHALGHVSDRLSAGERAQFLTTLESYRAGEVPLAAALGVVGAWTARFEVPYLANQSFLAPYPRGARASRAPAAAQRGLTTARFSRSFRTEVSERSSQVTAIAALSS